MDCGNDRLISRRSASIPSCRALVAILLVLALALLAPLTVGAANLGTQGRWLTVDGGYPYLVGMDAQHLVADPSVCPQNGQLATCFDGWLGTLTGAGINKVRVWVYNYFGADYFYPWVSDGTGTNRRIHLDQFDPVFWQRMRTFAQQANARGVIVEVTIFAPNSLDTAAGWNGYTSQGQFLGANAWNSTYNYQGAFNSSGSFIPQFFRTDYAEGSLRLDDFQTALLDKTFDELSPYTNVYFEICNEFPLRLVLTNDPKNPDLSVLWHDALIGHLATRTPYRIVSAHAQEGWGGDRPITGAVSPAASIFNFHFTVGDGAQPQEPDQVSSLLRNTSFGISPQEAGQVLFNNESQHYVSNYTLLPDMLDLNTRTAWAMLTSGGYFSYYVDEIPYIGNTSLGWNQVSARTRGMKYVAESLRFWEMSAFDDSQPGDPEFDGLVTQGPTPPGKWQVLAEVGEQYLVYFWNVNGSPVQRDVLIDLPEGIYEYKWYDARRAPQSPTFSLGSGEVTGGGVTVVPAPLASSWNAAVGAALTLVRAGSGVDGYLDSAACDRIGGWAQDPDTTAFVTVEIYDGAIDGGGTLVASTVANQRREDVGPRGFSIPTPSALFTGQTEDVYAYAVDLDAQGAATGQRLRLSGSPKQIACLAPPTGVDASDGTFTDRVRVSWKPSAGAVDYEVLRSTSSNSATAAVVAAGVLSPWDDLNVTQNTTYHYWVRANSPQASSSLSARDSGFAAPAVQTLTLYPYDDAYVDEADAYGDFGGLPQLYVRGLNTQQGRYSLLKFSVPAISGTVLSAQLQMKTLGTTIPGAAVYRVTGTNWSEASVDWENWDQNGLILSEVGSFTSLAPNQRHELALATGTVTGNGTFSFGLASLTSFAEVELWSREGTISPDRRPRLKVQTSSGQNLSLLPLEDAWLAQDQRYNNFGTGTELKVRRGGVYGRQSLLKFQVSGIVGTVTGVTLSLHTKGSLYLSDLKVYKVQNAQWGETTATWDTWDRNGWGYQFLGATGQLTANTWHDIDVTPGVAGVSGALTLGLSSSYDQSGLGFSSRETTDRPRLVIEYQP